MVKGPSNHFADNLQNNKDFALRFDAPSFLAISLWAIYCRKIDFYTKDLKNIFPKFGYELDFYTKDNIIWKFIYTINIIKDNYVVSFFVAILFHKME